MSELQKIKEKYNLDDYDMHLVKLLRKQRPKLYTVIRKVSSSGMSRQIDVYLLLEKDSSSH